MKTHRPAALLSTVSATTAGETMPLAADMDATPAAPWQYTKAARVPATRFLLTALLVVGVFGGCGGSSDNLNQDVFAVEVPRIAFLGSSRAVVSYVDVNTRAPYADELVTLRAFVYDLGTGLPSDDLALSPPPQSTWSRTAALVGDGRSRAILMFNAPDEKFKAPDEYGMEADYGTRSCAFANAAWTCAPVSFDSPPISNQRAASIAAAMDGNGNALAVFESANQLYGVPFAGLSAAHPARTFVAGSRVGDSLGSKFTVLHDLGVGWFTWTSADRIWVARYLRSSDSWEAAQDMGPSQPRYDDYLGESQLALHPGSASAAPMLVLANNTKVGNAGEDSHQLLSRRYVPGSGWSAAEPVPHASHSTQHRVAMAKTGQTFLAWVDNNNHLRAQHHDQGAWATAAMDFGNIAIDYNNATPPALVADGTGNAVLMWSFRGRLLVARYIAGSGWRVPFELQAPIINPRALALEVAENGTALAAWAGPPPQGQGGSRLQLQVLPFDLVALRAPRHLFGGQSLALTLELAGPVTADTVFDLSASGTGAGSLNLPTTLRVSQGQASARIDVPTAAVTAFTDVVLTARRPGGGEVKTVVDLMPPPSLTLTLPPSLAADSSVNGAVSVTPVYPVSFNVALSSDNPDVSVPALATILVGTNRAAFTVSATQAALVGMASLTAQVAGVSVSAPLAITAATGGGVGPRSLTVYVQGGGRVVSSNPRGIDCVEGGNLCQIAAANGSTVQLTATPDSGFQFASWSGNPDCSDAQLTMTADITCIANFTSTAAAWTTVIASLTQTPANSEAFIDDAQVALTAAGVPVVAWAENEQLFVRRADGSVSQPSANAIRGNPSLALDATDEPLVAFEELVANEKRNVRVRRFSNGNWTELGGVLDTQRSADASAPSLRFIDGSVVVAWAEGTAGLDRRVLVRRWDGAQWQPVGSGGPSQTPGNPGIDRVVLVPTGAAAPHGLAVMWFDDTSMEVAELIGNDWVRVAPSPFSGQFLIAERADMTWTSDLGLVVAAAQTGGSFTVRHWAAGQWSDVGTARGVSELSAILLDVALSHGSDDGSLLLAHAVSRSGGAIVETVVQRFAAGSWSAVGLPITRAQDRHNRIGEPRALALVDHPRPALAVVLQGNLPGTFLTDNTLTLLRFE